MNKNNNKIDLILKDYLMYIQEKHEWISALKRSK
jgi:hypothetical protein